MDARGVQKLLDKTFLMADSAMSVGGKMAEVAMRDLRLPDGVKASLLPLYGEEALRRTLNYAGLGLALCRAVENHLDDDAARVQLESYRTRLQAIYGTARAGLEHEFRNSRALEFA